MDLEVEISQPLLMGKSAKLLSTMMILFLVRYPLNQLFLKLLEISQVLMVLEEAMSILHHQVEMLT